MYMASLCPHDTLVIHKASPVHSHIVYIKAPIHKVMWVLQDYMQLCTCVTTLAIHVYITLFFFLTASNLPNTLPTGNFCNGLATQFTWSSSWMNFVGISPRAIFPKMVSPPGVACCALSTSLDILSQLYSSTWLLTDKVCDINKTNKLSKFR